MNNASSCLHLTAEKLYETIVKQFSMQKVILKLFPTENLRTSVNKYTLNKILLKISFNRNTFQKFYHILFCTIGSFALVKRKKSPYAMINL